MLDFTFLVESYHAVGSRVTCSPPPTDTDVDYVALVSRWSSPRARLEELGYRADCGPNSYGSGWRAGRMNGFTSYRKGEVNLIVTRDKAFYNRFLAATSVAKRLNLLDKEDRIALFRAVLYAEEDR